MRAIDWTDYRQAFIENNMSDELAMKALSKKWTLAEVFAAQKEFKERAKNPLIEKAMMDENASYTRGNPLNRQILKENGQALASVIRAGMKK